MDYFLPTKFSHNSDRWCNYHVKCSALSKLYMYVLGTYWLQALGITTYVLQLSTIRCSKFLVRHVFKKPKMQGMTYLLFIINTKHTQKKCPKSNGGTFPHLLLFVKKAK